MSIETGNMRRKRLLMQINKHRQQQNFFNTRQTLCAGTYTESLSPRSKTLTIGSCHLERLSKPRKRDPMDQSKRGPGYYSPVAWRSCLNERGGAVTFSKSEKHTYVDTKIKIASMKPGPADYNPIFKKRTRLFRRSTFARHIGTELDRTTRIAARNPGPGEYDPCFPMRSPVCKLRRRNFQLSEPIRSSGKCSLQAALWTSICRAWYG